MSNNQPILIKNPAPQQVEFSEVTGKITRKVNHFNDHAAKVTGGVEETLHEQAATTVVNRQHASEAGQNASARLQGEAGLAVRPNIQQAADSSAAENRVHEDGTNRLTDGGQHRARHWPIHNSISSRFRRRQMCRLPMS